MKAKIYVGAKKYALYIGRKIIEKTLEFLTLPARFISKKVQDLKNYLIYGNSKQSILPDGYTRLQYIESTTNQYIDTGIKGELESELTFKGQLTKYNTAQNYGHLWGDLENSSTAITFNTPSSTTGSASSRFGNVSVSSNTSPVKNIPLDTPVTIIQNKNGATTTTGFEITFNATTEFTTVNSLYLFSTATSGGVPSTATHKWKCEYYSHKKNGVLVQEFIPCKNPQGEIGMYDTVSGTFFGSNSNTSFVAGDDYVPTPETPVEIESVGDRTSNLLDASLLEQGSLADTSGIPATTSASSRVRSPYVSVKENTTYTIYTSNVNFRNRVHCYNNNQEWINAIYITIGKIASFTTLPNTAYIRFVYQKPNTSQALSVAEVQAGQTFCIEGNATESDYEPYYDGYKIPVTVGGKNLFNPNVETLNKYIAPSDVGTKISYGASTVSKSYLKTSYIKKGKYVYSFDNSTRTGSLRFCVCNDDEIILFTQSCPVVVGRNEILLDIPINGWVYVTTLIETNNIQIELGNTATEYAPYTEPTTTNIYLNEPLRKIGEYADYIDFENKKVVRNIGSYNATKLTNLLKYYGVYSTHNLWYFDIGEVEYNAKYNVISPVCNIFKGVSLIDAGGQAQILKNYESRYQYSGSGLSGRTNINRIYFNYDGITDVNSMLNKLNELNVEINTIIETPIEETIDLPTINLQQGTLMIDTDTIIKPSKISITGDIDNE